MYGNLKTLPQLLGEALHLLCLYALDAAHPQRQTDDNFCHLILAYHTLQLLEIKALILPANGFQSLGCNSQRIGNRQPNGLRAHIQTQDSRGMWLWLRPSWRDRKSTRLNSSHVSISYAV